MVVIARSASNEAIYEIAALAKKRKLAMTNLLPSAIFLSSNVQRFADQSHSGFADAL